MADRFTQQPKVEAFVTIRISEAEAGALDALTGYGIDAFIRVFYKQMGETYMKPFEPGLRSLFKAVRDEIPQFLHNAKRARKAFDEPLKATTPPPKEPT
ncbi:MAG: hypothetical protein V4757_07005 [Pseudomonadota bacterium]